MVEGLVWIAETYASGYCVTFARGLEEPEMLGRFVDDLSRAWLVSDLVEDEYLREELEELEEDGPLVHVGSCGGWTFALEDGNSSEGTRLDVLQRVSAGTIAVSVFYNVNAHTRFCYAENGVIIGDFDPLNPTFENASPPILDLLHRAGVTPVRAGRAWNEGGGYDYVAAMFDLAEAAGVRLDREAVAERPLFRTWIT